MEEEGRPEGRDLEPWLDAERELADDATDAGKRGISNHPSDEESDGQRNLPPRSTRKENAGEQPPSG